MTTLRTSDHYPQEFHSLAERLDRAAGWFRAADILGGVGKTIAVLLPLAVAILILAGFVSPGPAIRLLLIAFWLSSGVGCYFAFLHRALWQQPSFARIARAVEQHAPADGAPLHNQLINAVQLAEEYRGAAAKSRPNKDAPAHHAWIPKLLKEIDARTAGHNLEQAVPWRKELTGWYFAAAGLALLLLISAVFPATLSRGMQVLFSSAAFVPRQGKTKIVRVLPGNASLLAGQSVVFSVRVKAVNDQIVPVRLHIAYAGGKSGVYSMAPFGQHNARYRYTLATAAENMRYFINAGDSQSNQYAIRVLPHITLNNLDTRVTPPAYTHEKPTTMALAKTQISPLAASFAAPLGSSIRIAAALNYSIPNITATLRILNSKPLPMTTTDNQHFHCSFTLAATTRYRIELQDAAGRVLTRLPAIGAATGSESGSVKITAVKDPPPALHIVQPRHSLQVQPGSALVAAASAGSMYGLTNVRLSVANGSKAFHTVRNWAIANAENGQPARNAFEHAHLVFPAKKYHAGQSVRLRFSATDNRTMRLGGVQLGPQTARSRIIKVTFVAKVAVVHKHGINRWQKLQAALMAFLKTQRALRHQAAPLLKALALPQTRQLAAAVLTGQDGLKTSMGATITHFPFTHRMMVVRQALVELVAGNAANAADRARDITLLSAAGQAPPIGQALRTQQNRVIDVLESCWPLPMSTRTPPTSCFPTRAPKCQTAATGHGKRCWPP